MSAMVAMATGPAKYSGIIFMRSRLICESSDCMNHGLIGDFRNVLLTFSSITSASVVWSQGLKKMLGFLGEQCCFFQNERYWEKLMISLNISECESLNERMVDLLNDPRKVGGEKLQGNRKHETQEGVKHFGGIYARDKNNYATQNE